MKIIFSALVVSVFAVKAHAQVQPNLVKPMPNYATIKTYKVDTALSKFFSPQGIPLGSKYFNLPPVTAGNSSNFLAELDSRAYSSRMPVAHLSSNDNMNMPVPGNFKSKMPVKTFTVAPNNAQ